MSDYCCSCEDLVYKVWQLTDIPEKVERFVIEGVHFSRNRHTTRTTDTEPVQKECVSPTYATYNQRHCDWSLYHTL